MSGRRGGLRERWLNHVVACQEIDGETRALLLWMGARMSDSGAFSGHTRDEIAHAFGVIGRRIAERFERAQRVQLLDRVGGGYKGHPAVWRAVIPTHPKCAEFRTLSTSKGAGFAHPISAPYKRTEQADTVRDSAPHDARVTNASRESNDHECNEGVGPDHDVTEDKSAPTRKLILPIAALSGYGRLPYAHIKPRTA